MVAVMERPMVKREGSAFRGSSERELSKGRAKRITEQAFQVLSGNTKLIDITHLTGEEALKFILARR